MSAGDRPRGGAARVVVTSRRAGWAPVTGVQAVRIGELSRMESIDLLHKHLHTLPADDAVLDVIAGEPGNLPLALHLAGSFLWGYRDKVSPPIYLTHLSAVRSPTPEMTPSTAAPSLPLRWHRALAGAPHTTLLHR